MWNRENDIFIWNVKTLKIRACEDIILNFMTGNVINIFSFQDRDNSHQLQLIAYIQINIDFLINPFFKMFF